MTKLPIAVLASEKEFCGMSEIKPGGWFTFREEDATSFAERAHTDIDNVAKGVFARIEEAGSKCRIMDLNSGKMFTTRCPERYKVYRVTSASMQS